MMGAEKRVVAIIQARMGSSRLPGKALRPLAGKSMLAHVIERVRRVERCDEIVVATSTGFEDEAIAGACARQGVTCFRGDERNVLNRFYRAAQKSHADVIMRIAGDSPLLDWNVTGRVLSSFLNSETPLDYASNIHPPTYPDGLDTEVFTFNALERTWTEASLPSEREYVTPYIRNHPDLFRSLNLAHSTDLSGYRWTVDEGRDALFIERLLAHSENEFPLLEESLHITRHYPEMSMVFRDPPRQASYAVASLRPDAILGEPLLEEVA